MTAFDLSDMICNANFVSQTFYFGEKRIVPESIVKLETLEEIEKAPSYALLLLDCECLKESQEEWLGNFLSKRICHSFVLSGVHFPEYFSSFHHEEIVYPHYTRHLIFSDQYRPKVIPYTSTVEILGQEWILCDIYSKNMGGSKRQRTTYNNGLSKQIRDPFHIERAGRLGELAFAKLYGLKIDGVHKDTDVTDFYHQSVKIDVKVALENRKRWLICVFHNSQQKVIGKRIPLRSDLYIFGSLEESPKERYAKVTFCGWMEKKAIETVKILEGFSLESGHFNYVIEEDDLSSFSSLPLTKMGVSHV